MSGAKVGASCCANLAVWLQTHEPAKLNGFDPFLQSERYAFVMSLCICYKGVYAFLIIVSIPSTPFFYIKKALADFVYQLKPLLITQRKSFCNCREATSRSPLRSDRLGGAVRFP